MAFKSLAFRPIKKGTLKEKKKDLVYGYIMLEHQQQELRELLEPHGQDWNKTQGIALKSEINTIQKQKVNVHGKSKFSPLFISYPNYISLLLPSWPYCDDNNWMCSPEWPVKAFALFPVLHVELDWF